MSAPFQLRSWLVWAGAGAACLGVGLVGTLIPIHHAGPARAARPAELAGVSGPRSGPGGCVGSPARVAGLGAAALVTQRPSPALSPALDGALGATSRAGGLALRQVDVLDASATAAEVVIGAKDSVGSVGIGLHLALGCVAGRRVVVGARDVAP